MTSPRQRHASPARGKTAARRRNDGESGSAATRRLTPPAPGVRLQKAMADAGLGARRDCENMITTGRVRVNGRTIDTLPCFIDPARDIVELDGEILRLSAAAGTHPEDAARNQERSGNQPASRSEAATAIQAHAHIYVLINKPKGVITTTRDPEGRRNVLDLVPLALRRNARLFPVGRLDGDSTGLLLLTNDGDLAYRLTHPKFGVTKEYRVTCAGLAGEEQMKKLRAGMYLFDPRAEGAKAAKRASMESVRIIERRVDRARGDRTLLSIRLREGQNREIRRMLARTGLKVRELERVAIGPLRAPGLKPGQARLLGKKDVDRLRAAVLSTKD
ncbi:hypothetical protein ACG33_12475 [Steroidobacter denitrificans]|uniref:Pseudouridine synthase n=1 Tax=Steroidobacter denitrificans TaxID=465721 RepID=A0A127FBV2_STEDE|nr:pseudouridine synthase [Steroidobacter denitrificans]AMN47897.1 hypothetical protein ACG33_12475 [Steroidobacter denitrificans]